MGDGITRSHVHIRKRRIPWLGIGFGLLAVVLLVLFLLQFRGLRPRRVREHVQIHVLRDTPPPPPPEEREKIEEIEPVISEVPLETKIEEIPEVLEEAPPELTTSGPVAADGKGTIKAGTGGERGVIGGSGGRGTYNKYARFAGYIRQIERELRERLRRQGEFPSGGFEITLMLTLDDVGIITAITVLGSSGNNEFDSAVEAGVRRIGRIPEPPPPDMPRRPVVRISQL